MPSPQTTGKPEILGFRSGSTQLLKLHLAQKVGMVGKTTRQEIIQTFMSAERGIFVLRPRYLKDIIQSHRKLGVFNLFVPHTEEYTLPKEDFFRMARFEIPDIYSSIEDKAVQESLPEFLTLLREPSYNELLSYNMDYFQRYYWSLVFHSEVHKVQIRWDRQRKISDKEICLFAERLGGDVFEEIKTVLYSQNFLFDPENKRETVYEFIAYFLQFYNFAPQSLLKFFPLIKRPRDLHAQILAWGMEEEKLLEASRPEGCISASELLFYREAQIDDPDQDLDIFQPAYYLERVYASPAIIRLGISRDQFREQYASFFLRTLLPMVVCHSRIIGQLSFHEMLEKARIEGVSWDSEKLLAFDSILADGFSSLYRPGTWLDHFMVYCRGVVCLQDVNFREGKETLAQRSLAALQQRKNKIERTPGKRHWLHSLAIPFLALAALLKSALDILLWPASLLIYGFASRFEPYSLWAQRIMDRSRRKQFERMISKAIVAGRRGNIVRAIFHYKQAMKHCQQIYHRLDNKEKQGLYKVMETELQQKLGYIEERFAKEHSLDPEARENLRDLLEYIKECQEMSLLQRHILQDIQNSYIDPNKEYFHLRLLNWIFSLGSSPLRISLQGVPLRKKLRALKSIEKRLCKLKVREKELKKFQAMLDNALHSVELELRGKLGRWVGEAMEKSGITPGAVKVDTLPAASAKPEADTLPAASAEPEADTLPAASAEPEAGTLPAASIAGRIAEAESQQERIACEKIKQEILDHVVDRGHMQFADLRDVISRNNLKMKDLSGPKEFILGDALLKLDRQLGVSLAGIHRPAEIYMRLIHRFNSLLFGWRVGRWICKYIFLPFGGSYVFLELACYILHLCGVAETVFLRPFQPLHSWLFHPQAALLEKLHPNLPMGFGGLGGEIVLTEAMFWVFKLAWSLSAGFAFLFFFYTRAGEWLRGRIWDMLWEIGHFFLVEIPKAVWFSSLVQFFYKLRLWNIALVFVARPVLYSLPIMWILSRNVELASYASPWLVFLLLVAIVNGAVNTLLGRWLVDWLEERIVALALQINSKVLVALFQFVLETFKLLMKWLEQFMYLIDDYLRFRKGDRLLTQVLKATFGKLWNVVTYVVRFSINLILEPQINPIKHFPVVTISHKILFPISMLITELSRDFFKRELGLETGFALTAAMAMVFFFVQFGMPGVCGFTAWELKEDWKLYRHARPKKVKPSPVGSHGEKVPRLLKPGFHSGTIPKLYRRMRQTTELMYKTGIRSPLRKVEQQRHHVCQSLERASIREFRSQFVQNSRISRLVTDIQIGHIEVYTRKIQIPVNMEIERLEKLRFAIHLELKDELVCSYLLFQRPVPGIPEEVRDYLNFAYGVFCKKAAVDIVEEQVDRYVEEDLKLDAHDYHRAYRLNKAWLNVTMSPKHCLGKSFDIAYNLQYPDIIPRLYQNPQEQPVKLQIVPRERIMFRFVEIAWADYDLWMARYSAGEPLPKGIPVVLLPNQIR